MTWPLSPILAVILVFLIAFVFYGLIPGIGAFAVRARWRGFRKSLGQVSLCPFVHYADLTGQDRVLGNYRFFGELEAIQGRNRVWITNGSFTVEADLEDVAIYLLPSPSTPQEPSRGGRLPEQLSEEEPRSVLWQRIYSLPAGTRMFVGGTLELENGRAVFRSRPREPLAVVIYDGPRETILQRAIWGGRQRNEYWNRNTLATLITGSFFLCLIAILLLRFPLLRLPALVALALSAFPLAALLPPGVGLYFLYRGLWKKARLLRAERDLLVLPLRYFREGRTRDDRRPDPGAAEPPERMAVLPTGEPYLMIRNPQVPSEEEPTVRGWGPVLRPPEEHVLFGTLREKDGGKVLARPADPMAELVLIQGDPLRLSKACDRRAQALQLVSALLIFAALAVNLFAVLVALIYLIR